MTIFLVALAIIALTGVDQLIKVWAIENLKGQAPRSFLPIGSLDWMHLRYLENEGAAFSMLSGSRLFLIVFPIIMISLCLYLLHRLGKKHRWLYPALTLIAAGGLGNLVDRIFRGGAVVDYLDLQLFKFAVFNFADCCVTIGVVLMFIGIIFLEKEVPDAPEFEDVPRAKYVPRAAEMATVDIVPDAPELPDAPALPEAEPLPEQTDD